MKKDEMVTRILAQVFGYVREGHGTALVYIQGVFFYLDPSSTCHPTLTPHPTSPNERLKKSDVK